ncbi:MAG TPA: META domain-containing protein, partial [Gemmatimonadaceae bacterium]
SPITMRIPIVAFLAVLPVVACSSPQVSVGRPPAPLVGTDWKVFELHDLPTIGGPYQTPATFRIDTTTVTGFTGCNRLSGPVTYTKDRIRFGPLAVTRMACMDVNVGRVEAGFLAALNAAERQRIIGDTLILSARAGDLARFVVTRPR